MGWDTMGFDAMKKQLDNRPDFVYVVFEEGDFWTWKIGHGVDPVARVKQLNTGNHRRLELLCTLRGGEDLEKEIHFRFAEHKIGRGGEEWFKASPELRDFIKEKLMPTDDSILVYQKKSFGGPINIAPVELGEAKAAQPRAIADVGSVRPHSIVEAHPSKNPYSKVGRK